MTKAVILLLSALFFAACRNHIFPTLGILSCCYLIYYLPPTSWLRFAAWLNCGFVIYAVYGSVHSRLTGRNHSNHSTDHDAYTASIGAWLALAGTALLFCTRGFDLWLEAGKNYHTLPALTRAGTALTEVLRIEPWLEMSWFLVIPLVLNACVLCPVVIRRSWRARRAYPEHGRAGSTTISLSVASVLGVMIVVYMLLAVASW
jgi:hypothetical protein